MRKQLTERQYNFCDNYIKTGNAYESAKNAGYSETFSKARAHDLVNNPLIKEHLIKAHSMAIETLSITYEWKIKTLQDIIHNFMKSSERSLTPQDAKVIIQAITVLNDMQGHNAPDRKFSVTIDATKERLKEVRKQYDEY